MATKYTHTFGFKKLTRKGYFYRDLQRITGHSRHIVNYGLCIGKYDRIISSLPVRRLEGCAKLKQHCVLNETTIKALSQKVGDSCPQTTRREAEKNPERLAFLLEALRTPGEKPKPAQARVCWDGSRRGKRRDKNVIIDGLEA